MDKVISNISTVITTKAVSFVLTHRKHTLSLYDKVHFTPMEIEQLLKLDTIVKKSVLEDVVVFHFAFYGDEMSLVMRLLAILFCVNPVQCIVGKLVARTHVFSESSWTT